MPRETLLVIVAAFAATEPLEKNRLRGIAKRLFFDIDISDWKSLFTHYSQG